VRLDRTADRRCRSTRRRPKAGSAETLALLPKKSSAAESRKINGVVKHHAERSGYRGAQFKHFGEKSAIRSSPNDRKMAASPVKAALYWLVTSLLPPGSITPRAMPCGVNSRESGR
jgi:hypothetical protein